MENPAMLSNGAHGGEGGLDARRQSQLPPNRNSAPSQEPHNFAKPYPSTTSRSLRSSGVGAGIGSSYSSPAKKDKKHIVFQLIDPENPNIQARLPMRVMISPSDTTESIIATIKNFYGLYEYGVSFENKDGVSMIAAYENFDHDMSIYVRTVALPLASQTDFARDSASPKKPTLGAPIELRPPLALSPSRSAARSAGIRSLSPQSDAGRRSLSVAAGGKPRPQRTKSKDNSVYGEADGYSSDDNGEGSVASSRRSKAEVVNAEISVDNIVEGGRRKRAFESSELPLFVPPQVPMSTSISSVSPQRRAGPLNAVSPYAFANQQTFSYQQPLPSPISYGSGVQYGQSGPVTNGNSGTYQPPSRQLRGRPGPIFYPPRHSGVGILATPDPTVGSAISDEDVALQLMRLGDPMAFSHGRTSNSTLDDALSGKAEAASSDEEDDEDEDGQRERNHLPSSNRLSNGDAGPTRKKQRLMNELPSDVTSGDEYDDHHDGTFCTSDEHDHRKKSKSSKSRVSTSGPKPSRPRTDSLAKPLKPKLGSSTASKQGLVSPASMPAPSSRKGSVASTSTLTFQHPLGTDEEDLSSKPRCQRCRKSKKGCDRQRPCGRCKDAGIGVEGCVSEDEGNGRKGRFGRHMGVSIKKSDESLSGASPAATSPVDGAAVKYEGAPFSSLPLASQGFFNPAPFTMGMQSIGPGPIANGGFLAPALPDKSKKRKR